MTSEIGEPLLPDAFHHTDAGNAERLVAEHGRDIRYAPGVGWFVWDGRRWKRDGDGELMRRAKASALSMYQEIVLIDNNKRRQELAKWAGQSESGARLREAVTLAASDQAVIAQAEELDWDPDLLNVQNGTINLSTGEPLSHDRDDLITKLAPVEYDPTATSERWDGFLADVTGSDAELARFLQRWAGYCLTGHTSEEKLLFVHGPAATGKSTLLEGLKAALGEYAMTADFETFLKKRGDGGIKNDIARLAGARLVVSIEVDDGKRLAEGLVKLLTGGDTVAARFLYHEVFEYRPQFKLVLAANARPSANSADDATWRRIVQMPFAHIIPEPERNERVKLELRTDPAVHAAILAWGVRGAIDWRNGGLEIPDRVRDYTAEYRAENDPLGGWLEDACLLDREAWTSSAALRASYTGWCDANGETPIATRAYAEALAGKGCEKARVTSSRGWKGIGLQ